VRPQIGPSRLLNWLGEVYVRMADYQNAESTLKRAVAIFEPAGP
jgi:hypothetical protein